MTAAFQYSVVVPVYRNAGSLPDLCSRLEQIAHELDSPLEVVFVNDGSPDDSFEILQALLPNVGFASQLVAHSRNFGSFAAIRTGMAASRGEYIGVMAADLQEPPELMLEFFRLLASGDVDVAVGKREARADPRANRVSASLFWKLYRAWIFPQMPEGGVDIFACNRKVSAEVLDLKESHSSLVGLLYWVGFRRAEVPYERLSREHGSSGWSFRAKIRYLLDSVFSFTDLPLSVLIGVGIVGGSLTILAAVIVLISFIAGGIREPGYTPLMLVILFSTFSLLLALGIVGSYVWRSFENTKQRPSAIVMSRWISDAATDS
ncbi:glycosyltransferase family 2 protein [Lacisediminihabitans sp. H27-G8]|uniref:glycosyltransferase family 2 protein n=1 Tax=Lacisediminihabitans sp. H27-G8 TaxID=3111909 RepID=UPI0038FC69DF